MVVQLPWMISVFQHQLFQGVERNVVMSIIDHSHLFQFRPQTQILRPGDKPTSLFIIFYGWIAIYRLTETGREVVVRLYGPTDLVFGDLLSEKHCSSNIGATSKVLTHALGIPLGILQYALSGSPKLAMNLLEILGQDLHNMGYLLEQITAYPAVERVEKLLLQIMLILHHQPVSSFVLPVKKSELAHLLGLSRETFSRNLHELTPRISGLNNNHVTLKDPRSLCEVCDLHTASLCKRFNDQTFCRHATELRKVVIVNG